VESEVAEELGIDTLAGTDNRGSTLRGNGLATAAAGKILMLVSLGVLVIVLLGLVLGLVLGDLPK